jgi:hypothetical protein
MRDKHGEPTERNEERNQRGRFSHAGALRATARAGKGNGSSDEQRERHG